MHLFFFFFFLHIPLVFFGPFSGKKRQQSLVFFTHSSLHRPTLPRRSFNLGPLRGRYFFPPQPSLPSLSPISPLRRRLRGQTIWICTRALSGLFWARDTSGSFPCEIFFHPVPAFSNHLHASDFLGRIHHVPV